MNSVIGLKNPDWDLNKSKYSEIDDFPLMGSLGPVVTILAVYLVFVMKVGPAFMRKREAYKLTHLMLVYNGVQVVISAYMVVRFFFDLMEMGLVPRKCYMDDYNSRKKILFGTFLYLSAKFTELLDTVFFVLRKKESQITFLHLYHHSIMVIGTWAMLKYCPSHTLMFIGFFNSLVHVFMYTYYGLAALGPHVAKYLTWKKYMTKFQLIQFVSIIIQYVSTVRVSECPPSRGVATFIACNTGFFFLLFLNFYRQSYNKRQSERTMRDFDKIQKNISNGKPNVNVMDILNHTALSYCSTMSNDTSICNDTTICNDISMPNGKASMCNGEASVPNGKANGTVAKKLLNGEYTLKND